MDASPSPTIEIHPEPVDAQGRATARFAYISDEGWGAVGHLVHTGDGVAISEITISGKPFEDEDLQPITSTVLRHVPTGKILASALGSGLFGGTEASPANEPTEKRQPGRQPLSASFLNGIAEMYLTETAPDKPRGAIQRMAERHGKPAQTISRWVMRARADGWLGPAVPGREGAEPGPRLLAARELEEYSVDENGNVVGPQPQSLKSEAPEE